MTDTTTMSKITSPTLLIDQKRCRRNIKKMIEKAKKNNLIFRPHFKTHQSLEVGHWFKEQGITKITVSSLQMAKYFSDEWHDITVAFPVNILEFKEINELASKIKLNLLVESTDSVSFLNKHVNFEIGLYIKIDVGSRRTGIPSENTSQINSVLESILISDNLTFLGFLSHSGHTYACRSQAEVLAVHERSTTKLVELKRHYQTQYPDLILSIGDTPSCSIAQNFDSIDEIRPGNFIYYDLMQLQIGSCSLDDIGVVMACPIVALHPERNEVVIYGGGIHFSKEFIIDNSRQRIYGRSVNQVNKLQRNYQEEIYIQSLSQEHGVVSIPSAAFDRLKIGDILYFLPVHSCMTANLMMGPQAEFYQIY